MHHPRLSRPAPSRAPLALALAMALAPGIAAAAPGDAYALRMTLREAHQAGVAANSLARPPAQRGGTTRPVTSCADDADPGTLRNVLAVAEEGDTVDLSALTCSTITLTQGEIDTSVLGDNPLYDITVQGPGREALTIEAGGLSQVFVVGGFSSNTGTFILNDVSVANGSYAGSLAGCIVGFGGAVELNRVTVTNCHSSGTQRLVFGGAVDVTTLRMTDSSITGSSLTATGANGTGIGGGAYATGDAELVRSTVSGNTVVAPWADRDSYITRGGGLYVNGNLHMVDSTVSGNTISASNDGEDAGGGGIYVRGVASIHGSTISGNSADGSGGGVFKAVFSIWGDPPPPQDTRIDIFNSTISGNSAADGAGIVSRRPAGLWNSTVAFNQASGHGGGLMLQTTVADGAAGELELQSTILAANTDAGGASDIGTDAAVTISGANNLVMAADPLLQLPADTLQDDPSLLPLADNGGLTLTHALDAASPALDAGNNAAALEFDQRGEGFAREVGAAADVGAFELQAPAEDDTIFRDGFETAPPAAD
jgi:putative cofactor-binding repeat protein